MSESRSLADKFNNAAVVTSTSGKSVLLVDNTGEPYRTSAANIRSMSLTSTEQPGTTLTLPEFIRKYVQGRSIGFSLSDMEYANTVRWYLNLKDGVSLSMQEYMLFITKNKGSVDSAWSFFSFMLFPCSGSNIYSVSYITDSSASNVNVYVKRLIMTNV